MLAMWLMVQLGAGLAVSGDVIVTLGPEHDGQAFGREMAWLGDVDGDGYDDVLIMDPFETGAGYSGRAYVYFGGPDVDDVPDLVLQQNASGRLQKAVKGPFDFNGDGYGDIAISARDYDIDGHENAGAVFVYFGGPDIDAVADVVIPGPWTRYYFGTGLARAGRFDDDGYDDLAVTIDTIYGWGPPPTVYVFAGGPTPPGEAVWHRVHAVYLDGFPSYLAFAGDTNGDGAGDLVHGLPWTAGFLIDDEGTHPAEAVGATLMIHGGSLRLAAGHVYQPTDTGTAALGDGIDGAFDFNGDGLDDVIAAAPSIDAGRILFGSTDLTADTVLALAPGRDVAGLGDVNGDGFDDVAVVDSLQVVWIFQGGAQPDAVADQMIRPDEGEVWDQVQVGRAGDVDGDGRADVLVHIRSGYQDRVRIYRGSDQLTGVAELPGGTAGVVFTRASPNPFNPRTTLAFRAPVAARIQVRLCDARGRLVRSLFDEVVTAGEHTVPWDGRDDRGRDLASGIYLVQVLGPQGASSGTVTLLK